MTMTAPPPADVEAPPPGDYGAVLLPPPPRSVPPIQQIADTVRRPWTWPAWAATTGGAAVMFLWMLWLLWSQPGVFYPGDYGQYVIDAEALFGDAHRGLTHPPLPALLLGFIRAVPAMSDSLAAAIYIATLVTATGVGVFVWLSRHLPAAAAVFGAAVVLTPLTAEIAGWGGLAMHTAIALVPWLLTALDRWLIDGLPRRHAAGAGLAAGAIVASHPLIALVAAAMILVRVAVHVAGHRTRPDLRRFSVGALVAAGAATPLIVASLPFYFVVNAPESDGAAIGLSPDLAAAWDLVWWATRETLLWRISLITAAAVALIGAWRHPRVFAPAAVVVAAATAMLVFGQGDSAYLNRVLYLAFVPAAAAVGFAAAWIWRVAAAQGVNRLGRNALLIAGVIAVAPHLGFTTRLDSAVRFYGVGTVADVAAYQALADGTANTVLTGRGTYFFVTEGLTFRPVMPDADTASFTLDGQAEIARDAQRVFFGKFGAETDAVMVAADAAVTIGVRHGGDWEPVLTSTAVGSPGVTGDGVRVTTDAGAEVAARLFQTVNRVDVVTDAQQGWVLGLDRVEAVQAQPDGSLRIGGSFGRDPITVTIDPDEGTSIDWAGYGREGAVVATAADGASRFTVTFDAWWLPSPSPATAWTRAEVLTERDVTSVVVDTRRQERPVAAQVAGWGCATALPESTDRIRVFDLDPARC